MITRLNEATHFHISWKMYYIIFMSQAETFYDDGLNFECNGCSYCCRFEGGVVLLSKEELFALAEFTNLTAEQFIKVYCRFIQHENGTEYLILKTLQNGDCIFWNSELFNGKGGCECYEARPSQCSSYPFWEKILSSKISWEKEKSKCPGINCGKKITSEEIKNQLEKYRNRIPLTKSDLTKTN